MISFIVRRALTLIPILFLISFVSFVVIELPPGDWVSFRIESLRQSGLEVGEGEIARLTMQYGLDKPFIVRYFQWISNILLHGDFGYSFQWNEPVSKILAERVPATMFIAVTSLLLSWIIATPIGIISAVRQYSAIDYGATFVSFVGLAMPGFLLALFGAYFILVNFNFSPLGLCSQEYCDAPWSPAKLLDSLKHIILPVFVIGLTSLAVTIRVIRANLLDELKKQYVITARAKGLPERKLLMKYPVRMAINPLISTVGFVLPALVGGEVLVSIVLSLQTTGPVLLRAVQAQDMYLAGGIILILSTLTVIGTLISDIALAGLDPRIRFGGLKK
jgi:peptide/nickel transport system permease protein